MARSRVPVVQFAAYATPRHRPLTPRAIAVGNANEKIGRAAMTTGSNSQMSGMANGTSDSPTSTDREPSPWNRSSSSVGEVSSSVRGPTGAGLGRGAGRAAARAVNARVQCGQATVAPTAASATRDHSPHRGHWTACAIVAPARTRIAVPVV